MAESQARERLLEAAAHYALESGIADLSLRELAAAIGTSHRMLIYHFGRGRACWSRSRKRSRQTQRGACSARRDHVRPDDVRAVLEADQQPEVVAAGTTLLRALRARVVLASPEPKASSTTTSSRGSQAAVRAAVDTGCSTSASAPGRRAAECRRRARTDPRPPGNGRSQGVTEAFERYLSRG